MKAMVIIPTTTRPVVITSLRERRNLPASLIVAEGDFRALPISNDYDKLIGVAGPLGTLTGQGGLPSHELRLSHAFETGRSWEVPVCIAHYLAGRGATLVKSTDEAELVVWATGAIDIDLSIVKDRYYLGQKLQASLSLIEGLKPGTRLEMYLPGGTLDGQGSADMHRALAEAGVTLAEIRTVRDAVGRLEPLVGGTLPAVDTGTARSDQDGRRPHHRSPWRLVAGLAGLAVLFGGGWLAATGRLIPSSITVARGPATPPSSPANPAVKQGGASAKAASEPTPAAPKVDAKTQPIAANPAQPTVLNPLPGTPKQQQPEAKPPQNSDVAAAISDKPPAPKLEPGPQPGGQGQPQPPLQLPNKAAPTVVAGEDLLIIEEQRAPSGSTCRQLSFSGERPEISLLRSKDGRFPASDANGLCALIYRRSATGAGYTVVIDAPLMNITMDKASFDRTRVGVKAGDVGRVLKGDIRGTLSYHIHLKPLAGSPGAGERRYIHELRR